MKKPFILFALAVSILLSACGGTTVSESTPLETEVSTPAIGMDAQNKYAIFSAISFQEADGFFCGSSLADEHLYYYDKETVLSGLLCADPACTHDSSSCGACVKSGSSMFLYAGQRYWITNDVATDGRDFILWQGDIGGTNQKKVKTIGFEDVILTYQPQQYALHRGSLIFLGSADVVSGVNTGKRITLVSSPLDSTEEFTPLFDQTYSTYVNAEVRYIKDSAFLLVQEFAEAGGVIGWTVYQIDLHSGETEIRCEEHEGASCGGFWVTDQEEIYLATGGTICKVENRSLTSVGTMNHSDDLVKLVDGIAISTYLQEEQRCIEIVDFSGNTIYDGKMFTADIPGMDCDPNEYRTYSMLIVGGDSDKLIIELTDLDSRDMESYMILLDLNNNLEPTLLWKVG